MIKRVMVIAALLCSFGAVAQTSDKVVPQNGVVQEVYSEDPLEFLLGGGTSGQWSAVKPVWIMENFLGHLGLPQDPDQIVGQVVYFAYHTCEEKRVGLWAGEALYLHLIPIGETGFTIEIGVDFTLDDMVIIDRLRYEVATKKWIALSTEGEELAFGLVKMKQHLHVIPLESEATPNFNAKFNPATGTRPIVPSSYKNCPGLDFCCPGVDCPLPPG